MRRVILSFVFLTVAAAATAENLEGQKIFNGVCASCHGEKGEFGSIKPAPINSLSQERIEERLQYARDVENKRSMDRIKASLTPEQAKKVAEYVSEELSQYVE